MRTETEHQVFDAIQKVYDLISRNGLYQGWLYNERQHQEFGTPPEDCAMCLVGAVNTVVYGKPSVTLDDVHESSLKFRWAIIKTLFVSLPPKIKLKFPHLPVAALMNFSDNREMDWQKMLVYLRGVIDRNK